MTTPQIINTIANVLALITLALKTIYDLIWNKRQYQKQVREGADPLTAAEAKRRRSDISFALTFIGLSISYLLLLIGGCQ